MTTLLTYFSGFKGKVPVLVSLFLNPYRVCHITAAYVLKPLSRLCQTSGLPDTGLEY